MYLELHILYTYIYKLLLVIYLYQCAYYIMSLYTYYEFIIAQKVKVDNTILDN